ncbi:MAG: hypothetical protein Q3M30_16770 [Candidatus Electrothrix sp. Rat3]|uniref:Uncharacterized protein n=1 Tax=Candidatus Electrothrix marina TaxID=1859130 RepID=A0A444JCJ4_9BACT|nr:hypothetical protein [Candidatus Electrothrix rattekaaiensis]RWX50809.1 hypothetical protein VU00_10183 [Candidatus Electrothrix marina]RWX51047.1 hypothetical protein VU01_12222 [Candidatus Electrothrix marina]
MNDLLIWLSENIKWIFSGIGVFFISLLITKYKKNTEKEDEERGEITNGQKTVGGDSFTNISGGVIINRSCNKNTQDSSC